MKKSLIFVLLLCLSLPFNQSAKAETEVNLRTDPMSLLFGVFNIQADYKISEHWSLGPTAQYLNTELFGFEVDAMGLGVRANYFFTRPAFTQGWYIGPSINYLKVTVADNDPTFGKIDGESSGLAITSIFGYQWMWESFNINLGAGPVLYTLGTVKTKDSSGVERDEFDGYSDVGLAAEFSLGWKF